MEGKGRTSPLQMLDPPLLLCTMCSVLNSELATIRVLIYVLICFILQEIVVNVILKYLFTLSTQQSYS